jgi:hypothetical protein
MMSSSPMLMPIEEKYVVRNPAERRHVVEDFSHLARRTDHERRRRQHSTILQDT